MRNNFIIKYAPFILLYLKSSNSITLKAQKLIARGDAPGFKALNIKQLAGFLPFSKNHDNCILRKIEIRPLILVVFSILLITCNSKQTANTSDSDNTKKENENIQSVGIVHPTYENIRAELSIIGTAMPYQKVQLHAMESGFMKSIHVDIGDYVKRGAVIARLENPDLKGQDHQAQAEVHKAEALLLQREAELKKWTSVKASKKSIYDRLNNTYQKAPNLVLVSDVENAKATYEEANASEITANANIAAAKSEIVAAQALASALAKRVKMLTITAPFSGVIVKRNFDIGAAVQSALSESDAMSVVELQETQRIRLTLHVPESDVNHIVKGTSAQVTFPELHLANLQANISRTSGALDSQSKTMQAEIDLDNAEGIIKPGMYARVLINPQNQNEVLSLPQNAKIFIDDITHILVVEDELVKEKSIRSGLEGRLFFEILNPEITTGTEVIVQGKSLVKEGQKVKTIQIERDEI